MNIETTKNNIKIEYSHQGYLDDIPYHLISDKEMFNAFLSDSEDCYFSVNYPEPSELASDEVKEAYANLKTNLSTHIDNYLADITQEYEMPDWVYSYMLGYCISPTSKEEDILYLNTLLGFQSNPDGEFSLKTSEYVLKVSKAWIAKLKASDKQDRSPTIFGEPHVIKSLRINNEL